MCQKCWAEKPRNYEFEQARVGDIGSLCKVCDNAAKIVSFGHIDHERESISVLCKCLKCKTMMRAQLFAKCDDCLDERRTAFTEIIKFSRDTKWVTYNIRCATCRMTDEFTVQDLQYKEEEAG